MLSTSDHPDFQSPIETEIDGITVDHNALLRDLLESDRPLPHIASDHKLKLSQLLTWAAQPPVRALLAAADELAHRRASHAAAQSRQIAITTLTSQCLALCESIRGHDIANRAARALLRISDPDAPPRRVRQRPTPIAPDTIQNPGGIGGDKGGDLRGGMGVPPISNPPPRHTVHESLASIPGAAPAQILRIPVFRFRLYDPAQHPISKVGRASPPADPTSRTPEPNGHHDNGQNSPPDPTARDP